MTIATKVLCRGGVQRARPLVLAAIRALDVAASGDPRWASIYPRSLHTRSRGPRSDRPRRLEIVDRRQPARRRAAEIEARLGRERLPASAAACLRRSQPAALSRSVALSQ